MMKIVFKPIALRELFPPFLIMMGLWLWTVSGLAATISSVSSGGNWNVKETWVGGNVPTKLDSVVINGTVNLYNFPTVNGLEVLAGATLQTNPNSNYALTVNGDVTNHGTIKNNDSGHLLTLSVSGNITNNGTWKNQTTHFISGMDSRTIEGNPISSAVRFDADFAISNSPITFAGDVDFASRTITLSPEAQLTFLKQVSAAQKVGGPDTTLFFKGSDDANAQLIQSGLNGTVILSGSGEKNLYNFPTINGSLVIEEGIILQTNPNSNYALTVNGDVTNCGTIKDNDSGYRLTIRTSGSVLNQNTWVNGQTLLSWPGGSNQFNITEPLPITDISAIEWPEPISESQYDITELLKNKTVHYWRFKIKDEEGERWSSVRSINDPTLISRQLASLLPEEVRDLTPCTLKAFNLAQFKQTPSQAVSKVLTNLDTNKVSSTDAAELLPPGWTVNPETGALTAPAGSKLTLQALPPPKVPIPVTVPTLPNLNTGFGVGGAGPPVLTGIGQVLAASNLTPKQDDKGIMNVKNPEQSKSVQFSVIPDVDNITQVDKTTNPPGLSVGEGGFYQITTPNALEVQFIPAPKPVALSETLEGGEVSLGKDGDVLMEIPESTRQRGRARMVAIFSPIIEPAPEDLCVEITPDEIVCDFDNAPAHLHPGFHLPDEFRTRRVEKAKVVYQDGTSQTAYPTLLYPDIFIKTAFQFEGVEKVIFNANGTFYVQYQGLHFLITPNFKVTDQELPEGETVAPSIALNPDSTLTYTVTTDSKEKVIQETQTRQRGRARQVLSFRPLIELAPDDLCVEIEVGEIICDFDKLP
ncbi:hypothetical protein [Candidatus Parabeggiatoa sp. HSG14]|uniref:hypothetical protein n=1 Tax=Candidatus Parabeggiatoa sp. HSG14 TaxID=3055593 RepID=UPI0025A79A57|nr:hypothetical protein [Thiotrichales bacterium HSG14]